MQPALKAAANSGNYMILRLTFLVVASVAALAVSKSKHSDKTGSIFQRIGGEEEEHVSDQKAQMEKELKRVTRKTKRRDLRLKNGIEIELQLHSLVKELEERKLSLEGKSLELCGLKEQQSYFAELRRHLEDKMTEIDTLNGTIDLLGDEIKNLQKEMKQARVANSKLEMAKKSMEELQMKMDVNAGHRKRQLMKLEEQVYKYKLQCNNERSVNDAMVEEKLKATRQVELEYVEIHRRNKELELEKRELTVKLLGARAKITALSNMTQQDKVMAEIEDEISNLRQTNEDLSKEVEGLQRNRFNMVEELVYQRWLNACLRFETQIYQKSSRNTSCDISINANASHKSDKKAEQLVSDHSFDSISSFTSSTESNELDSSTTESSSNSQSSITNKSSFMHIIKRRGRSKDDLSAASSPHKSWRRSLFTLVRRHSTSMVPSNRPSLPSGTGDSTTIFIPSGKKMMPESNEYSNTPKFPRVRRVSFCDSVETFVQGETETVENLIDDIGMCNQKSGANPAMDESSPICPVEFAQDRNELSSLLCNPSDSSMQVTKDILDTQVSRRIEAEKLHSRIPSTNFATEIKGGTSIVHVLLLAVLLLCLLMLLPYFLISYC